uniref:Cuticle protein 6 n=1 Tax=Strigamia maritima TaxID=126957 RepID=T1JCF1_STRMM
MKNLWIFALFSTLFSIAFAINPFRLQMVSQAENGAYDFAYDTGDGYHIQSRDDRGTVTGKFAYIDPEGQLREIDYKADDNGFHPSGDIHPKRFANTKLDADTNFAPSTIDSSFTLPQTPLSGIPNEYLQPEEIKTFLPEHVIGPVPNARFRMDSVEVDDTHSQSGLKSRPIVGKPSFPIAALLSTGTLPDTDIDKHIVAQMPRNDDALSTRTTLDDENERSLASRLTNLANPGERKVVRNIQYFTNPRPLPLPLHFHTPISAPRFEFSPVQEFLNQRTSPDDLRYTTKKEVTTQQRKMSFINDEQSAKLLNALTKLIATMPVDKLVEALENLEVVQSTVAFDQPMTRDLQQIVEKLLGRKSILNSTNASVQTFSDDASLKVHQTPVLGSPLYTPVEGIREVDGEKLLHRTYVPFTKRYGYVLTQRAE